MSVTFQSTEPGIAYEYAVILDGRRIGRVHKQDSPFWPYAPTRKWVAVGPFIQGNFATRDAAAAWVASWVA